MGLNFTSTNPSLRLVLFFRQIGYVASPDCLSTFGFEGAVSSATTAHFASPMPVLVAVHPAGASPTLSSSKFTVSASAEPATSTLIIMVFLSVFILILVCGFSLFFARLRRAGCGHHLMLPEDFLSCVGFLESFIPERLN